MISQPKDYDHLDPEHPKSEFELLNQKGICPCGNVEPTLSDSAGKISFRVVIMTLFMTRNKRTVK